MLGVAEISITEAGESLPIVDVPDIEGDAVSHSCHTATSSLPQTTAVAVDLLRHIQVG